MRTATAPTTLENSDGSASANSNNDYGAVPDSIDDFDISDFCSSHWKAGIEIGLTIRYPLPFTNYLTEPTSFEANNNDENQADKEACTAPMTNKSIVIGGDTGEIQEREYFSTLPPLSLSTIFQETSIAPIFDGTTWTGTRLWKAAVVGLEYLLREHSNHGGGLGSLLELGCGLGVPGMIWKQMQRRFNSSGRVVLTDRDSLVPQLRANISSNFQDDPSVEAFGLDWSRKGITSLLRNEWERSILTTKSAVAFDICLNCDCVFEDFYGRSAWKSLADVLSEVARLSPQTLLVTALERRNGDNAEGFLERLEASGTVMTPVQRVVRHHQGGSVIEIYVTQGKTTPF